jgi:hypothetical protein
MAEASGFVLTKSAARDGKVAEWIDGPMSPDLEDVPGIGGFVVCRTPRGDPAPPRALTTLTPPAHPRPLVPAGDESAATLTARGINSAYQLLGYFLMLRGREMTTQAHCDRFYRWLRNEVGLRSNCHTIVRCIGERANTMFAGIYREDDLRR